MAHITTLSIALLSFVTQRRDANRSRRKSDPLDPCRRAAVGRSDGDSFVFF
jgi:hypothetical protein